MTGEWEAIVLTLDDGVVGGNLEEDRVGLAANDVLQNRFGRARFASKHLFYEGTKLIGAPQLSSVGGQYGVGTRRWDVAQEQALSVNSCNALMTEIFGLHVLQTIEGKKAGAE